MGRKRASPTTEVDILIRSRRRCAICFGLYRDAGIKQGQIAHLDTNRNNNTLDNLVFLCLPHHDSYDTRTSQSKGMSPSEVKRYREELDQFLAKANFWPGYVAAEELPTSALQVSPEVYDKRIGTYRSLRELLTKALGTGNVKIEDLQKFADDTDEAFFLFGQRVADYLGQVQGKAVELRAVRCRLEHPELLTERHRSKLIDEESRLLNWLTEQLSQSMQLLKGYLTLAGGPQLERTVDAAVQPQPSNRQDLTVRKWEP